MLINYAVYKCLDCGEEFEKPASVMREYVINYAGSTEKEWVEECPCCGSDMIKGGEYCECCGDKWAEDDTAGNYICKDCIEEAGDAIEAYGRKHGLTWDKSKKLFLSWAEQNW